MTAVVVIGLIVVAALFWASNIDSKSAKARSDFDARSDRQDKINMLRTAIAKRGLIVRNSDLEAAVDGSISTEELVERAYSHSASGQMHSKAKVEQSVPSTAEGSKQSSSDSDASLRAFSERLKKLSEK